MNTFDLLYSAAGAKGETDGPMGDAPPPDGFGGITAPDGGGGLPNGKKKPARGEFPLKPIPNWEALIGEMLKASITSVVSGGGGGVVWESYSSVDAPPIPLENIIELTWKSTG